MTCVNVIIILVIFFHKYVYIFIDQVLLSAHTLRYDYLVDFLVFINDTFTANVYNLPSMTVSL